MKTYVRENEHKDEYIKRVRYLSNNNKYLKVRYASGGGILGAINGMRNYKIEANEDRIENINYYMESEAQKGKEKLDGYKKLGGICAVLSAISTSVSMSAPTAFEAIASTVETQANLEDAAAAVVVAGAVSAIATGITAFVNIRKVLEINKLNYRDENQVILDQVKNYPSAMDCLSNKKKKLIQQRKNPFGVIWSEDYRKRDLKKIVTRIKQALILGLVSENKLDFPLPREQFQALQQPAQPQPTPIAQPVTPPIQQPVGQPAPISMTPEQIQAYLASLGISVDPANPQQPVNMDFFQNVDSGNQNNSGAPQYRKK